jgi:hypothetical protein
VWWIVWLWKDEPGAAAAEPKQEAAEAAQLSSGGEESEGNAQ